MQLLPSLTEITWKSPATAIPNCSASHATCLPRPITPAHLLLEHSKDGVVFVPIRSMQYLAVIDHEEIIFLDSEHKSWVDNCLAKFSAATTHRTD